MPLIPCVVFDVFWIPAAQCEENLFQPWTTWYNLGPLRDALLQSQQRWMASTWDHLKVQKRLPRCLQPPNSPNGDEAERCLSLQVSPHRCIGNCLMAQASYRLLALFSEVSCNVYFSKCLSCRMFRNLCSSLIHIPWKDLVPFPENLHFHHL